MIKFIIKETFPFEGFKQWTVFANDFINACALIKSSDNWSGEELKIHSQRQIKGTKKERIHKYTSKFYQ